MSIHFKKLKKPSIYLFKRNRLMAYIVPMKPVDGTNVYEIQSPSGAKKEEGASNISLQPRALLRATIVEVDPKTGGPKARHESYYRGAWHRDSLEDIAVASSSKTSNLKQRLGHQVLLPKRVPAKMDLRHSLDKALQTGESLTMVSHCSNRATSLDVRSLDKGTSMEKNYIDKTTSTMSHNLSKGIDKTTSMDIFNQDKTTSMDVFSLDKTTSMDILSLDKTTSIDSIELGTDESASYDETDTEMWYDLSTYDVTGETLLGGSALIEEEKKQGSNGSTSISRSTMTNATPTKRYCDASVGTETCPNEITFEDLKRSLEEKILADFRKQYLMISLKDFDQTDDSSTSELTEEEWLAVTALKSGSSTSVIIEPVERNREIRETYKGRNPIPISSNLPLRVMSKDKAYVASEHKAMSGDGVHLNESKSRVPRLKGSMSSDLNLITVANNKKSRVTIIKSPPSMQSHMFDDDTESEESAEPASSTSTIYTGRHLGTSD